MDRRLFLISGIGAFAGCATRGARERAEIQRIETQIGGRIGVAALDTGNSQTLSYRGDEKFAMCSTFKWLLTACVLARVDAGSLTLAQRVAYSKADLLEYAPVTTARVGEGTMSIGDLCAAIIEVSDNTAANLLLSLIGGPVGLTGYLRSIGDEITRLDRTEPSLNTNLPNDPRDTTTPRAMVATMKTILTGNALSGAGREQLQTWLKNCRTGAARLRAGLPAGWIAGDKTGSGANGAVNDVAIAWPPGRPPILIASYMSGSSASADAVNAAHAEIAALAAAAFA